MKNTIKLFITSLILFLGLMTASSCSSTCKAGCGYWGSQESKITKPPEQKINRYKVVVRSSENSCS